MTRKESMAFLERLRTDDALASRLSACVGGRRGDEALLAIIEFAVGRGFKIGFADARNLHRRLPSTGGLESAAPHLRAALADWRDAIGPGRVVTNRETCRAWGRRTFGPDVPVAACLRPASADDVAACLAITTRHGIPMHPVSRGSNWGLGSRAPTVPDAVVLDLRDLDAISAFDVRDGMVHVEPGVTFARLAEFLDRRTGDYFLPEIGGPVTASVLANALDRGDGMMGDRWGSLGDLDVCLPDGRRIRTGYSGIGAHWLAGRTPPPSGPVLDGLFSQSNFGVVVGGWVRLEPMPANLAAFWTDIGGLDRLPALVEAWRRLQRDGHVPDRGLTLWNGIKLLARDRRRGEVDARLRRDAGLGAWYLSGLIPAATPEILASHVETLDSAFRPRVRTLSVTPVRRKGAWLPGGKGRLGTPGEQNLHSAYWREAAVPEPGAMDPDRDGCGLIWLCLAFPFKGGVLAEFAAWAAAELTAYDLDLNIGVEASSFRTLLGYLAIGYDRSVPGMNETAMTLYGRLLDGVRARGLAPYRLANGIPLASGDAANPASRYAAALQRLGDPAGILSPGRGVPVDRGPVRQ